MTPRRRKAECPISRQGKQTRPDAENRDGATTGCQPPQRGIVRLPIYFALHLPRAADMNFLSCGSLPGK